MNTHITIGGQYTIEERGKRDGGWGLKA